MASSALALFIEYVEAANASIAALVADRTSISSGKYAVYVDGPGYTLHTKTVSALFRFVRALVRRRKYTAAREVYKLTTEYTYTNIYAHSNPMSFWNVSVYEEINDDATYSLVEHYNLVVRHMNQTIAQHTENVDEVQAAATKNAFLKGSGTTMVQLEEYGETHNITVVELLRQRADDKNPVTKTNFNVKRSVFIHAVAVRILRDLRVMNHQWRLEV